MAIKPTPLVDEPARLAQRGRSRRASIYVLATLGASALGFCSLSPPRPALIWNFTPSIPTGLYRLDATAPLQGEIAAVRVAGRHGAELEAVGALSSTRLLLKPVAARDGDVICRRGHMVSINGKPAARARDVTSAGAQLPKWSGCHQLAPNEIFLLAKPRASFDGRYFGPIDTQYVVGTARAVFSFAAPAQELP